MVRHSLLRRTGRALFLFIILIVLVSCSGRVNPGNQPLEPEGPVPAPHDGVFVSEQGRLIFNGDGTSIEVKLQGKAAELFEVEEGSYEGTYVFLSGDLPPNGSFPIRYDAAHELKIDLSVNGETVSRIFDLGIASADGKSGSVGLNTVSEEKIPLLFSDGDHVFDLIFVKE